MLERCFTFPQVGRAGQVAQVYDFLEAHERAGLRRPLYFLAGSSPSDWQDPRRAGRYPRRILLRDLLAYREQRRAEQYAALEATAVDLDDEQDLDTALEQLREARRAVAGSPQDPRGLLMVAA